MGDRELLELAARAAGIALEWDSDGPCYFSQWRGIPQKEEWNPLTSDGDAFRLAVKLRFHVCIFSASDDGDGIHPGFVEVNREADDILHVEYVQGADYAAAARRAIVVAITKIGRSMT
jgi:hypothetical protein